MKRGLGVGTIIGDGNQISGGSRFKALNVTPRPVDYAANGAYRTVLTSGTLAAALAAGTASAGHLFAMRWGHASKLAAIFGFSVQFQPLTPFTAATLTDFGFDAFQVRTYTASHSGGNAAVLTGDNAKQRKAMATSLLTDMRIASTAQLTAGTQTFDAQPFAASLGDTQRVNPAAATEEVIVNSPNLFWDCRMDGGGHPIILAQDEGIVIRNRAVWPAAGTGILQVAMHWAELDTF